MHTHSLHVQHMLERQREKEGEKKEREREREKERVREGKEERGIVCVCIFSVRIFISACIYFTFQEVHVIVVIHAVYNSAEGWG